MSRRRSAPWIHRWSRQLIGAIAILGALDTAYLTLVEWGVFEDAACPVTGAINCQAVLSSAYAKIFGIPLSLFGFLAYVAIAACAFLPQLLNSSDKKGLRTSIESWTWLVIFAGSTAMVIFSGYLVYLMSFKIGAFCIYCLASALFSITLFVLTLIGRSWEDIGQLFFIGVVVGMVTLISTLGVYAQAGGPVAQSVTGEPTAIPLPTSMPQPPLGWPVTTTSGEAEIALARHLTKVGVKEYGAYWCPHCYEQKQLFGKPAYKQINYIECAPDGKNGQPQLCKDAGLKAFPSWEINGKLMTGVKTLEELADLTGYKGPRTFKYKLPE